MAKKVTAAKLFADHADLKKKVDAGAPGFTQRMVDGALARATDQLTLEMKNKEVKYIAACGADWWELVRTLYPITMSDTGKFVVTSEACDWAETMEWAFDTKYDALAKIDQLIEWKYSDRVHKGHGNFDEDVEKLSAKVVA